MKTIYQWWHLLPALFVTYFLTVCNSLTALGDITWGRVTLDRTTHRTVHATNMQTSGLVKHWFCLRVDERWYKNRGNLGAAEGGGGGRKNIVICMIYWPWKRYNRVSEKVFSRLSVSECLTNLCCINILPTNPPIHFIVKRNPPTPHN